MPARYKKNVNIFGWNQIKSLICSTHRTNHIAVANSQGHATTRTKTLRVIEVKKNCGSGKTNSARAKKKKTMMKTWSARLRCFFSSLVKCEHTETFIYCLVAAAASSSNFSWLKKRNNINVLVLHVFFYVRVHLLN